MGMFDLDPAVKLDVESDTLGRGPLDSAIYDFKIKLAYITKSAKGAMAINLNLETSQKQEMRQTIYISSGDAKGNKFTYIDKKTNEARPLPGYSQIDTLCKLAIGKALKELDTEEKTIGIYDFTAKKEIPTSVPVLVDLLNADISIGVLKITEDKKEKCTDASGKVTYVAKGESRTINEMGKFFRTDGHLTGTEIAAGLTDGVFAKKWAAKNNGAEVDKTTKVTTNGPTLGGVSPQVGAATSETPAGKSLFG